MSIRKGSSIIAGNIGQNVDSALSPTSDNPVKNSVIYDALRNTLSTDDITNCITEIPQDIKLELNNGTLTLKAGSKVYVPNGSGVFDEVVIANDISSNSFAGSIARFVFIDISNNTINAASAVFSGQTSPTLSGVGFWYDTVNNIIRRTTDGGATWTTGYSFPICIVTSVSDVATSIDQVFNGFGYISSTVFALPGVKGLIPNGRNADGTLNSTPYTINEVTTVTFSSSYSYNNVECGFLSGTTNVNYYTYNKLENFNYIGTTKAQRAMNCVVSVLNGTITSFKPKTVFHVVDYSDSEYIANCAMPSNRYIDFTLGASGTTYTAPADGYMYLWKETDATNQFITLTNNSNGLAIHQWVSLVGGGCAGYVHVKKGDIVSITYTAGGTTNIFRFIYSEGAV